MIACQRKAHLRLAPVEPLGDLQRRRRVAAEQRQSLREFMCKTQRNVRETCVRPACYTDE